MITEPGVNLVDMIDRHARHAGSQPAFIMGDETVTWSDFSKQVNRVANALIGRGLKKGGKVGFLALNSINAVTVLFGIMRAGGVAVPLSTMLTSDLICSLLQDSGAEFFFVDAPVRGLADKIGHGFAQTFVTHKISIGYEAEGWIPFASFIEGYGACLPDVLLKDEDEANIIYSSGTTGMPKGIIHTHRFRSLFCFSMAIETRIDPTSRVVFATPLFTNATWIMMLPSVLVGACGILMPSFTPSAFLETVARQKGTHSFMVPTQYQKLVALPGFDAMDFPSIRILMTGGGTMPLSLKRKLIEKFPGRFMELYGLTEGVGTTLSPEQMLRNPESNGTPIIATEVRVIDDKGREISDGRPGELVGTGGAFMKGYHNRPDATEEALWHDERGRMYLRTGDICRIDGEGYVYLVDRKKDMIVSGGLNVYPSDIEAVLIQYPDVEEVAVIGAPHAKWGETPLAIIVGKRGARIDGEGVKAWLNDRLAKPQRISRLICRESPLPRNALGKVLKKDLRDEYITRERSGVQ